MKMQSSSSLLLHVPSNNVTPISKCHRNKLKKWLDVATSVPHFQIGCCMTEVLNKFPHASVRVIKHLILFQ